VERVVLRREASRSWRVEEEAEDICEEMWVEVR